MTIKATIIADSVSAQGVRLTTFQLTYPRIIHSELMTHRVFSRNASSSRAIPVMKQIAAVIKDPAEPSKWGHNQAGMQAGFPLMGWRLWLTKRAWHMVKWGAVASAYLCVKAGAHKQIANRIMEPWSHISVVLTSTDWANWYSLRDHRDADPTIQELALAMKTEHHFSEPVFVAEGDWHLPYIHPWEQGELQKKSAARCARVSYLTHDGHIPTDKDDLDLYDKLVGSPPVHASPLEHQATPMLSGRSGNLRGWKQFRKTVPNEASIDDTYTPQTENNT